MTTIIDNTQSRFWISRKGFGTNDIVCNLKDIPNVLKYHYEKNDSIIIRRLFNSSWVKCSKNTLNEMFKNNNIDYKI